jgi:hypothetical protein
MSRLDYHLQEMIFFTIIGYSNNHALLLSIRGLSDGVEEIFKCEIMVESDWKRGILEI